MEGRRRQGWNADLLPPPLFYVRMEIEHGATTFNVAVFTGAHIRCRVLQQSCFVNKSLQQNFSLKTEA